MDDLKPVVLSSIFRHLTVPDLLALRVVNRLFNTVVESFAERIIYNVDVANRPDGEDRTSLLTLSKSKFGYRHFRVVNTVVPSSAPSIVSRLREIFSRATTLIVQYDTKDEVALGVLLVRAALPNLKSLTFDRKCDNVIRGSLNRKPGEDSLSLPDLEEFRVDYTLRCMSEVTLERVLAAATNLRALAIYDSRKHNEPWFTDEEYEKLGHPMPSEPEMSMGTVVRLVSKWCPNLESLDMSGLFDLTGLSSLCESQNLQTNLKKLVLDKKIHLDTNLVKSILQTFLHLETFSASMAYFSDKDLEGAAVETLVNLSFTENRGVTSAGIGALVKRNKKLRSLSLVDMAEGCDLGFVRRCSFANLTALEIVNMDVSVAKRRTAIKALASKCGETLTSLNLSGNGDVNDGIVRMAIGSFRHLRTLKLRQCRRLTDAGLIGGERPKADVFVKKHPSLLDLPHLVHLDLSYNLLLWTTAEFGIDHPSLEHLDIRMCRFGEIGLLMLPEKARNLRSIRLTSAMGIGREPLEEFVRRMPRLSRIDDDDSRFGVRCSYAYLPMA